MAVKIGFRREGYPIHQLTVIQQSRLVFHYLQGEGRTQLRGVFQQFQIVPRQHPAQVLQMKAHVGQLYNGAVGQQQTIAGQRTDIQPVQIGKPSVDLPTHLQPSADHQTFQFNGIHPFLSQHIGIHSDPPLFSE